MIDRKRIVAGIRAKARLNRLMTEPEDGPPPAEEPEVLQTVRPRDYRLEDQFR